MGDAPARPQPALALSNAIVGWYAEKFGRGPTRSKTYIDGDHATVILGDVQTRVERTLAAHGEESLVKEVRRTVKAIHRAELSGLVERTTGRAVVAMHSDHDPGTDTSVYVFLFAGSKTG
ncbi:MAG: DUF2294 domain-containing protein [Thermoleophilaceae bacterium]|nr:DUF2294 domain-containing protein [Thermoleophilaceae bacterium]